MTYYNLLELLFNNYKFINLGVPVGLGTTHNISKYIGKYILENKNILYVSNIYYTQDAFLDELQQAGKSISRINKNTLKIGNDTTITFRNYLGFRIEHYSYMDLIILDNVRTLKNDNSLINNLDRFGKVIIVNSKLDSFTDIISKKDDYYHLNLFDYSGNLNFNTLDDKYKEINSKIRNVKLKKIINKKGNN